MKQMSSFTKSLLLHIRYPWTAVTLLIMWIGVALMCLALELTTQDVIVLTSITGVATLVVALIGFRK